MSETDMSKSNKRNYSEDPIAEILFSENESTPILQLLPFP